MPEDALTSLGRAELAQLGREYMLAAQFNSRTGYAALRINHGEEAYLQTAIDNWMAASPVYTRRMQRAMRLKEGSDIAAILKGMQLECGLSHQYFDAGFKEVSPTEGEFWLNSCGPLLETEPRGAAAVKTMCHDIEDPTFDATAAATNPRARIRPFHRPPRVSPGQARHCHWRVYIDPAAEPLQLPEITGLMADTRLAQLPLQRPDANIAGGMDFYTGPVMETLRLEQFSQSALVLICKELAVQIHLLVNSLGMVVARRYGVEAALAVSEYQMIGSCRVISQRLARWLDCVDGGIDAALRVLAVHPAFQPAEYIQLAVEKLAPDRARIRLLPCAAVEESQEFGWLSLLKSGRGEGLASLLKGVDPRLQLAVDSTSLRAWTVELVEAGEEQLPLPVQVAMGTVLYTTKLENHLQYIEDIS